MTTIFLGLAARALPYDPWGFVASATSKDLLQCCSNDEWLMNGCKKFIEYSNGCGGSDGLDVEFMH
jgi:hypothetical protein